MNVLWPSAINGEGVWACWGCGLGEINRFCRYLDYGEKEWKEKIEVVLSGMKM
jgi:hypothetical protein